MHYYCGTCDSRIEGKLEIEEPTIMCKSCGRYYTMSELIILDNVYLCKHSCFEKTVKKYIIEEK